MVGYRCCFWSVSLASRLVNSLRIQHPVTVRPTPATCRPPLDTRSTSLWPTPPLDPEHTHTDMDTACIVCTTTDWPATNTESTITYSTTQHTTDVILHLTTRITNRLAARIQRINSHMCRFLYYQLELLRFNIIVVTTIVADCITHGRKLYFMFSINFSITLYS